MSYSVIIPTYNRAYCLPRTLDSILAQTKAANEIIVIDDGSTDNTQALIQQHYPQIIYLKQNNQGVSAARNLGIQTAQSDWIALLDSDDAWEPKKLEQQFQSLQNNPHHKICHTNEKWIRNGIRVNPMKKHTKKGGWIYTDCLPLCAISPSSVVIHKDLLAAVGRFDEALPACEDYDLWLRITSQYPVLYLEETLTVKYGGHDDQLSRKHWGMDRFRIYALEKILNSGMLTEDNKQATKAMLQQKVTILLTGAKKHGNTELLQQYAHYQVDI